MKILDSLLRRSQGNALSALTSTSVAPLEPSEAWVAHWSASDIAAKEEAFFSGNSDSLLSWKSRAFLYHCVRAMKPSTVVEIGTYMAGTARILAQALVDNGSGQLYTADPYGADRCPPIIRRWPAALQRRVTFIPQNSMALVEALRAERKAIDIAFIDGCHDFEFALFDALAIGTLMARDGLVIFDNSEQPGVIKACLEFMRINPDFREIGTAATRFDTADPFGSRNRSDVPGTQFVLLAAPGFLGVAPRAFHATGQRVTNSSTFRTVHISNVRGPARGTLFVEAWLRAFGSSTPLERRATDKTAVHVDDTSCDIDVPLPLAFDTPQIDRTIRQLTYEVGLFWLPDSGNESLKFDRVELA
jgi:predicted O-methyltransferase YrrM